MITLSTKSVFDAGCQAVVVPVNCDGRILGSGLAAMAKLRWPAMYANYRVLCRHGGLEPGRCALWSNTPEFARDQQHVIYFPSKRHWRDRSYLADIEAGLAGLALAVPRWGLTRVAMPKVGCGLGGLNWADVHPLIVRHLADLKAEIVLCTT